MPAQVMQIVGDNMKKIIIILSLLFLLLPVAWAKRVAAPKVEPVTHDGIQYIAPMTTEEENTFKHWM
jgi:hypothetical protein